MSIKNKLQAGQSIVEVLIATGVVALVMTALMAAMTLSLQNSSQAKYKALATKLGQEGMETFRQFRNSLGWESFYTLLNDQGSGEYCLNAIPTQTAQFQALVSGECADYAISRTGVNFKRDLNLQIISSEEIKFVVTVSWQDGADVKSTTVTQYFKNWR